MCVISFVMRHLPIKDRKRAKLVSAVSNFRLVTFVLGIQHCFHELLHHAKRGPGLELGNDEHLAHDVETMKCSHVQPRGEPKPGALAATKQTAQKSYVNRREENREHGHVRDDVNGVRDDDGSERGGGRRCTCALHTRLKGDGHNRACRHSCLTARARAVRAGVRHQRKEVA